MKPTNRSTLMTPQTVDPDWYVVDASDKVLGRLAVKIATVLMGKHKPTYTPHVDTGDYVIVINAEKVKVTGRKAETMIYQRYSGHPGGLKEIPYERMMQRHPERILQEAVRRMLPKSPLGRRRLKKLRLFVGTEHTHQAQEPVELKL